MLTKIKLNLKNEMGVFFCLALIAVLLIYNSHLIIGFHLENRKEITLLFSFLLLSCFVVSRFWNSYKKSEEKKYKKKLDNRFKELERNRGGVFGSSVARNWKNPFDSANG